MNSDTMNTFHPVPPALTPPATPGELTERTKLSRWNSDSTGSHLPRMPVRSPRSSCGSPTTPKFTTTVECTDDDAAEPSNRHGSQLLMIPTKFWYELGDRDTASDGAGAGVAQGLLPPRSPQRPGLLCQLPTASSRSPPSPLGFPSSKSPSS